MVEEKRSTYRRQCEKICQTIAVDARNFVDQLAVDASKVAELPPLMRGKFGRTIAVDARHFVFQQVTTTGASQTYKPHFLNENALKNRCQSEPGHIHQQGGTGWGPGGSPDGSPKVRTLTTRIPNTPFSVCLTTSVSDI